MSDSDERPNLDEMTLEAVRDLAQEVEELKAQGHVLLSGPASVQLLIKVEDAATPEEAVERVIRKIAHVGLDTFTFAVTDMLSGEDYFVQAGQVVGLDEVQAAIGSAQDGND